MSNNIYIRKTNLHDLEDILLVERLAFNEEDEAILTDNILKDKSAEPTLSLLAFHDMKPIGHILFSRAYTNEITNDQPLFHILAPLAVIPEYQKQGIGGMLIREGNRILKNMDSQMVFVLGHIEYYPRHGFIPDAKKQGYSTIYPIPEKVKDAWMLKSLVETPYPISKGKILCCKKLNKPEYWRE